MQEATMQDSGAGSEIETHYLDEQGVLMMGGHFPGFYTEYYLHLMQHGLRYEACHDLLLKEALAALGLHLASRPRDETVAWTWHFAKEKLNLFVTGNNTSGELTGRVFTDGVREDEQNLFFAQVVRPSHAMRQSVIGFGSRSAFRIVEEFYERSQQQLGRYFDHGDEHYRFVVAMPGADEQWIRALNEEQSSAVRDQANVRKLSTRTYRFACHCTLRRIVSSLASLGTETMEALFEEDDALEVTCPRCGARYEATLELLRQLRQEVDQ